MTSSNPTVRLSPAQVQQLARVTKGLTDLDYVSIRSELDMLRVRITFHRKGGTFTAASWNENGEVLSDIASSRIRDVNELARKRGEDGAWILRRARFLANCGQDAMSALDQAQHEAHTATGPFKPEPHEWADEHGLAIRGSEKPRVRKDMCGLWNVRCTCGWSDTRKSKAVAERKFREHRVETI